MNSINLFKNYLTTGVLLIKQKEDLDTTCFVHLGRWVVRDSVTKAVEQWFCTLKSFVTYLLIKH